jgi:hypothetical protein
MRNITKYQAITPAGHDGMGRSLKIKAVSKKGF